MLDFQILDEAGTTNERLRQLVTAAPLTDARKRKMSKEEIKANEKDVEQRKELEEKISSWLNEGISFSLQNGNFYPAVDLAWDSSPINKSIMPLILYAQGRLDVQSCARSLQSIPSANDYVKRDSKGAVVSIDLPKFTEVNINLLRSVITRRVAPQVVKYSALYPFWKYEPRSTNTVSKLRADMVSQRMDIMADQYDYRHSLEQQCRDMLLYTNSVSFPRAAWEREVQWERIGVASEFEDGKIRKRARIVKEGISWVNPHPSRVFHDNNYPLNSLNTDTGCEYVGFWDVMRWGDVQNNPQYFNKKAVGFSGDMAGWFTSYPLYFSTYFQCTLAPQEPLHRGGAANDRKNTVGLYNGLEENVSCFFTELFMKVTPNQMRMGDYPYPIWIHLKVAGDGTVVFAEIMPSSPAAVFSFNASDSRRLNISMAHELMPFQDQLTNLFSQLLETAKADMFSVAILNTDIFPDTPEGKAVLDDFRNLMKGQNFYASMHVLDASFEKLRALGIDVKPDNIFKVVRSAPNTALTAIFASIAQLISMAERVIILSAQEQGQSAPREISATETNLIAGATDAVYSYISNSLDKGRAAQKRIAYESLIAMGDDKIFLPVANRYPKWAILKAGFQVEDEDATVQDPTANWNVTGSKRGLIHDLIFTTRDGGSRAPNNQSAQTLVQLLQSIGQQQPAVSSAIISAMGKEKLFEILNTIFRLADAGVDMTLELKPGETDALMLGDEEQLMQTIQRLAQMVQQNTAELAQLKQMAGIQSQPEPPQITALQ